MDDGLGGDFSVIYDGYNAPSLTQFVVGGTNSALQVVAGRAYRLKLAARAFNGLGEESDITVIYACSPPIDLAPPQLGTVTTTSMTLTWEEPKQNGGCPITGYTINMDDGSSGVPTTEVSGMANDVPTLRETTVAIDTGLLGTTFTF